MKNHSTTEPNNFASLKKWGPAKQALTTTLHCCQSIHEYDFECRGAFKLNQSLKDAVLGVHLSSVRVFRRVNERHERTIN